MYVCIYIYIYIYMMCISACAHIYPVYTNIYIDVSTYMCMSLIRLGMTVSVDRWSRKFGFRV